MKNKIQTKTQICLRESLNTMKIKMIEKIICDKIKLKLLT